MLLVQLLLPIDWKCNYKPSYYLFRPLIANESSLLEKQTTTYNKISGRTIEITRSDFSEKFKQSHREVGTERRVCTSNRYYREEGDSLILFSDECMVLAS